MVLNGLLSLPKKILQKNPRNSEKRYQNFHPQPHYVEGPTFFFPLLFTCSPVPLLTCSNPEGYVHRSRDFRANSIPR